MGRQKKMKYSPSPLDTSSIDLSDDLKELTEELAENTHDIWAQSRIDEGWSYGPVRNDNKKTHPCLVPYEMLPENEKDYDRNTSQEALKAILKLGFTVTAPEKGHQLSEAILSEIRQRQQLDTAAIIHYWQLLESTTLSDLPIYLKLGSAALKKGEYLLACDIFTKADQVAERTLSSSERATIVSIRQQLALALAESGVLDRSLEIVKQLRRNSLDAETSGIMGRIYKSLALKSQSRQDKQRYFKLAFQVYHNGYKQNQDYYNGINAATLALLSGKQMESVRLADEVMAICLKTYNAEAEDPWMTATMAEVYLLQGKLDDAKAFYTLANSLMHGAFRNQNSMRKQAMLILKALKRSVTVLDGCFSRAKITVFTGHMIDHPERATARFPDAKEKEVRQKLRSYIKDNAIDIAYCSAACGADILFIEEMLRAGKEVNIVLPFQVSDFEQTSMINTKWLRRFRKILKQLPPPVILADYDPRSAVNLFDFCNIYISGIAQTRSQQMNGLLSGLAVWNGDKQLHKGGTWSVIQSWQTNNLAVDIIDISSFAKKQKMKSRTMAKSPVFPRGVSHEVYLPMLFADVKGYSQLNDQGLVSFSSAFLREISKLINRYDDQLYSKRTMGDGLFIVFKDLQTAVDLATKLKHKVSHTKWQRFDLPEDLQIRISLDAGPVYTYTDPIMDKMEFCGAYVNRAARMEPITPPGEVFVSESFVALSKVNKIKADFNYVGNVNLPKDYGRVRAFFLK